MTQRQITRLPCLSPTPRAYSNSCPSRQWYHPTILPSVVPFFSCPQSFPASGSFPISQFFTSGGQSIGVSASASVLPMNIQDWFPLGWTGWISLQSHGTVKSLLQHHSSKASILWHSAFFIMAVFKYVIKLKSEYPHTCPHYSITQCSSYCTGIHSFIPLFIHLFILFSSFVNLRIVHLLALPPSHFEGW